MDDIDKDALAAAEAAYCQGYCNFSMERAILAYESAKEAKRKTPEEVESLSERATRAKAMAKMPGILENFEITGPDGDGFYWFILHGHSTSGKAAFNLGACISGNGNKSIAGQVLAFLEQDRKTALAAYHAEPVALSESPTGMEKRT